MKKTENLFLSLLVLIRSNLIVLAITSVIWYVMDKKDLFSFFMNLRKSVFGRGGRVDFIS